MAAVRSPRGHFLLFTVLISFCITASLANVELLETIKENLKILEENLETTKAYFQEELLKYSIERDRLAKKLDPLMEEQRELLQSLPDFLQVPFSRHLDYLQFSVDTSEDQIDDGMVKLHREIVAQEKELEYQRMQIKCYEGHVMKVQFHAAHTEL